MKIYEIPHSGLILLNQEESFLTGASAGGFPVDPTNPFGGNSNGIMEEDEDYE